MRKFKSKSSKSVSTVWKDSLRRTSSSSLPRCGTAISSCPHLPTSHVSSLILTLTRWLCFLLHWERGGCEETVVSLHSGLQLHFLSCHSWVTSSLTLPKAASPSLHPFPSSFTWARIWPQSFPLLSPARSSFPSLMNNPHWHQTNYYFSHEKEKPSFRPFASRPSALFLPFPLKENSLYDLILHIVFRLPRLFFWVPPQLGPYRSIVISFLTVTIKYLPVLVCNGCSGKALYTGQLKQ